MNNAPWDIYAAQMFHHGFGYPLWVPDPAPGAQEVDIGDVGWLRNGAFHPLFNAMKGSGDAQPRGDVPCDYVPFAKEKAIIDGPRETITQPVLCGRSIRGIEATASVGISAVSPIPSCSAGVAFSFQCRDDYGAMLMLGPSAVSQDILSRLSIGRYMRAHFESWTEFANGKFGLGLKDEELLFVCGTTKTNRWGVAAFHGDYREKYGSLSGNVGSSASLEFSLRISDAQLQSSYYRTGPPKYRSQHRGMADPALAVLVAASGEESEPLDQCVFMHYYKMKRRLVFQFPMQAAASPRNPSERPDDRGPGSAADNADYMMVDESDDHQKLVGSGDREQPRDPVDILLDYILQYSTAQYALASDMDVYNLFVVRGTAETHISAVLADLSPDIFVDESGVGTLADDRKPVFIPDPGLQYVMPTSPPKSELDDKDLGAFPQMDITPTSVKLENLTPSIPDVSSSLTSTDSLLNAFFQKVLHGDPTEGTGNGGSGSGGPSTSRSDCVRELESEADAAKRRIQELEMELSKLKAAQGDRTVHEISHPPVYALPVSSQFEEERRARVEARTRLYCSLNRAGNALCAWHDSRRERRAFPPRMAPPGYLNCGCTYEEALFAETLVRHGVGSSMPGESVRMDPALRNPLLKLLEQRYGYRDGDFERNRVTGDWVEGEGPAKWEQILATPQLSRHPRMLP